LSRDTCDPLAQPQAGEAFRHHFEAAGVCYWDVLALLDECGSFEVFALTPQGLRREPEESETPG